MNFKNKVVIFISGYSLSWGASPVTMHCRQNADVCVAAVHGQIKKGVCMKLTHYYFVRTRLCRSYFPNDEMPSKNKIYLFLNLKSQIVSKTSECRKIATKIFTFITYSCNKKPIQLQSSSADLLFVPGVNTTRAFSSCTDSLLVLDEYKLVHNAAFI